MSLNLDEHPPSLTAKAPVSAMMRLVPTIRRAQKSPEMGRLVTLQGGAVKLQEDILED